MDFGKKVIVIIYIYLYINHAKIKIFLNNVMCVCIFGMIVEIYFKINKNKCRSVIATNTFAHLTRLMRSVILINLKKIIIGNPFSRYYEHVLRYIKRLCNVFLLKKITSNITRFV